MKPALRTTTLKSLRIYVCIIVLCALGISMLYSKCSDYMDKQQLQLLKDEWIPFGVEKGNYSFTVVTGLFDIGRGSWWTQSRTYNEYLGQMLQILKLDVNLIVFIEPKGWNFVKSFRKGREKRTRIYVKEIEDLEYYPLFGRIKEIMNSKSFQEGNENYASGKCEAVDPMYNLVTNSKITLVHEALQDNPFNSDYFIWLDGGYGHGNASIYPEDRIWIPRHLLNFKDKVSFTALEDLPGKRNDELNVLHKTDTAWIAGGLFAGGKEAMETFYRLHKTIMAEYMERGTIDDDQTTFSDCYFRLPSNFRPVLGSWYDLMVPFQ
ncbi:unnamed protein product [Lymnaea stagnalis]|uniref:Uncharacterized protein n=1 Tax=Lymnaea stagnalis TaxID=6523 RepID=A0AAV2H190_LYMST